MADKRIGLKVGTQVLSLLRATEANVSEEIDSDVVKTFDQSVSIPSDSEAYTIDVSVLEARSLNDFKKLKRMLKRLKTQTGSLSIYETVRHKSGDFETEYHFGGVSLKSNKIKYSADSLSARDLSFNATSMREIVDNTEI